MKDIVALGTPVLLVALVAITTLRAQPAKKPRPDRILMVCTYETPDDRALTYVVEGRDCGACRRHPLVKQSGGVNSEIGSCYRQIERGGDTDNPVPMDQGDPAWTAAEDEASRCDAPLRGSEACAGLKESAFACRRQCHRDPDCSAMCRSRCEDRSECPRPPSSRGTGKQVQSKMPLDT